MSATNSYQEMTPAQFRKLGNYQAVQRFLCVGDAQLYSARNNAIPVALAGRITNIQRVRKGEGGYIIWLEDLGKGGDMSAASLMPTVLVVDDEPVILAAHKALSSGYVVLCYGSFPLDNDGAMEIYDIRPMTNPTTHLGSNPAEIAETDRAIDALISKGPRALYNHLLSEIRSILSVHSDHLSQRHLLAEEAVLVQALAGGQVPEGINPRISMYLTGPPGSGKNLLAEYGRLLAPISSRVQPIMVSPAGLSAHVELTPDGWRAKPGVMPRSSGGLCVIDDVHRSEKRNINAIQGILMTALEEGVVRPHKSAFANYETRCSVIITSNRMSLREGSKLNRCQPLRTKNKVVADSPQSRAADLVLPFDLFSRTDLVFNLGTGDDPVRTAMKMATQKTRPEFRLDENENTPSSDTPSQENQRVRKLKMIAARLKERIQVVDLSPVVDTLEEVILSVGVVLREYTSNVKGLDQESYDGDALIRRMAWSFMKVIGGLARLEGRSEATTADVERAWELITPKLEVVRWICGDEDRIRPMKSGKEQVAIALQLSENRWLQILQLFGGKLATIEDIQNALDLGENVVRRELAKRKIDPTGAYFLIPTEAEWRKRKDGGRLDLSAELVTPPPDTPVSGKDDIQILLPKEEAPKFNDCMVELPKALAPIFDYIEWAEENLVYHLSNIILFEDSNQGVRAALNATADINKVEPPPFQVGHSVDIWIRDGDWAQRALRAGSLLATFICPYWEVALHAQIDMAKRFGKPIPDAIRRVLDALFARIEWCREQVRKEREAKLAREEAAALKTIKDEVDKWEGQMPKAIQEDLRQQMTRPPGE